jgi:hypothetical protein
MEVVDDHSREFSHLDPKQSSPRQNVGCRDVTHISGFARRRNHLLLSNLVLDGRKELTGQARPRRCRRWDCHDVVPPYWTCVAFTELLDSREIR